MDVRPIVAPSAQAISRAYLRGVGGRTPLMMVPGNELYQQPIGAYTSEELLAAVKYNFKFSPSKRLYREVISRNLWELALSYPMCLEHAVYFLEIVTSAPYPRTELNGQIERIIAEGVAERLRVQVEEVKKPMRWLTIFERDPGVRRSNVIRVLPGVRRVPPKKAQAKQMEESKTFPISASIVNFGPLRWGVTLRLGRDQVTGKQRRHDKTVRGSKAAAQAYLDWYAGLVVTGLAPETVSQSELQDLAALESTAAKLRENLLARVDAGGLVEPGPLSLGGRA